MCVCYKDRDLLREGVGQSDLHTQIWIHACTLTHTPMSQTCALSLLHSDTDTQLSVCEGGSVASPMDVGPAGTPPPPLPRSPSMPIVPVYQITVHSALMELAQLKPDLHCFSALNRKKDYGCSKVPCCTDGSFSVRQVCVHICVSFSLFPFNHGLRTSCSESIRKASYGISVVEECALGCVRVCVCVCVCVSVCVCREGLGTSTGGV